MSKKGKMRAIKRAIKNDGGGALPPFPHRPIDKPSVCPQCQAGNCKGCIQNSGVTRCGCTDPMHRPLPYVEDVPVPGYTPPQVQIGTNPEGEIPLPELKSKAAVPYKSGKKLVRSAWWFSRMRPENQVK